MADQSKLQNSYSHLPQFRFILSRQRWNKGEGLLISLQAGVSELGLLIYTTDPPKVDIKTNEDKNRIEWVAGEEGQKYSN